MASDSRLPLPFRFDSDFRDGPDAFARWQEEISITHAVSQTPDTPDPFHVSVRMWRFPTCIVTGGSFSAQVFDRPAHLIQRDHLDHYGLFAQGQGTRTSIIKERKETLRTGDLQIIDLAQTGWSVASAGESGMLYLPRDLLDRMFPGFSDLHGLILRTEQTRMLAAHIVAMHTYLDAVPPRGLDGLLACTLRLAFDTIGMHTNLDARGELGPHMDSLRLRVDRYLDANLGDSRLSPESVASTFHLSRSSLYRLFEEDGGVVRYLREKRLRRIHDILARGTDTRPLVRLAEDYGFPSGPALSRAFRSYYGYAPSDVRASTLARDTSRTPTHGISPAMRSLFDKPLDLPEMIPG